MISAGFTILVVGKDMIVKPETLVVLIPQLSP
jgi:hypothetical protein